MNGLDYAPNAEKAPGCIIVNGRKYITRERLAEVLGLQARSIACMQTARRAPPSVKIGRRRYYPLDKLEEWIESRVVDHAPA